MRDVETLLEALPYIRDFHGRTVVIKYGGAAMIDDDAPEEFARDVVLLKYVGMNPVVVHGGGPDITRYMERLGMKVEFVDGLRVSDEATVEVAKMVLVGKQNKDIVLRLGRHGQPAVGLCGDDGSCSRSRSSSAGERDIGFVGEIERVDADVLNHIAEDYIPVIASVGADRRGQLLQRQRRRRGRRGRERAARLQGRLPDRRRGVAGRPRRPRQPVIRRPPRARCSAPWPGSPAGMRPKLEACLQRARPAGSSNAHIVDGRRPHSLLLELFTDEGIGTKLVAVTALADLQALERDAVMRTYARNPVEFVRGEGYAALGRRGQRVPRLPRGHLGRPDRPLPPGAGRGRAPPRRRG